MGTTKKRNGPKTARFYSAAPQFKWYPLKTESLNFNSPVLLCPTQRESAWIPLLGSYLTFNLIIKCCEWCCVPRELQYYTFRVNVVVIHWQSWSSCFFQTFVLMNRYLVSLLKIFFVFCWRNFLVDNLGYPRFLERELKNLSFRWYWSSDNGPRFISYFLNFKCWLKILQQKMKNWS